MSRIKHAALAGFARVALTAAGVALCAPALALAPFVPISGYTIYGDHGVFIGVGSTITGLVGAKDGTYLNGVFNASGTPSLKMNGSSKIVGDARSGEDVSLANSVHITGTVTHPVGTVITMGSGSSVGADVLDDPNLPSLPAATPLTCPTGGADDSGGNGQSRTLSVPGAYGTYAFGGGFTLTFSTPGNYIFDAISTGNGSQVIATVAGVHVFVCGQASFGGGFVVTVPSSIPGPPNPNDISFEVQSDDPHNAFVAGGGSHVVGPIFAPNGGIHIGSGSGPTSFVGNLTGFSVDIEHGVLGSGGGGSCCQPGTVTSLKDSAIIHGDQNTNNGASPQIWVRSQNDSIVGFDISGLVGPPSQLPVSQALLVLTVCYTPGVADFCPAISSNWGPAGGKIGAYRLLAKNDILNPVPPAFVYEDWAEGIGNTFPVFKTRGTGPGVTWNCKTDTNIANNIRDCTGSSFWDNGGRNAQYPFTDTQTITNGMADGSLVIFDVTSDVNAGLLGDSTYISWFIRWSQQNGGFVSFYSQEGAARAGNTSGPTLVIIP